MKLPAVALLLASPVSAGDWTLRSGPAQIGLVELYSSEGCSSCPPADARASAATPPPWEWV